MSELPAQRIVSGDDLRGANTLMRDYFKAREEAGENAGEGVRALAEMGGMTPDFIDAAKDIAADLAQGTMEVSGTPTDADSELLLVVTVGALHNLIVAGYVHGMQVGALAGVGVIDPAAE